MSLDGYLATKNDDISWLDSMALEGEDYGYAAFNETVDTYIVGNKTYQVVLNLTGGFFPPADQHTCYVITRSERTSENGVTFFNGNIVDLVARLKAIPGKNIYCDGGATLVQMLMTEELIDEFIISVIPIVLGDGKRLFKGGTPGSALEMVSCTPYPSGLVTLHYKRKT